jgi:short-subunit dehydrogenase
MLINNAGVAMGALFKDVSLDDMRWIMDINFWGVVYGCKAFSSRMKTADEATIVNISSVFGLISAPMHSAYCASKFAVRGFSDALRHEVGYMGKNFKVACAFPAGVKTSIADNAKLTLHAKSGSSEQQQRARMEKLFLTTAEDAAIDILRGIKKGKTRIRVGKGSMLIDLLSRLLPVKYMAFL